MRELVILINAIVRIRGRH